MKNLKRVFMFRHGETDWNRERRWQGQTDVPLNVRGREQALALASISKSWNIEAIFSSDLQRAAETAQIIATSLQIPLILDSNLREGNFGKAEGMTKDEILQKYGQDFVRRWKSLEDRHLDLSFPEGETRRQILRRYLESMQKIMKAANESIIAVSTHGSVLKHFVQYIDPTFAVPTPIPNCAAFEFEFIPEEGRFRLVQMLQIEPMGCSSNDPEGRDRTT